MTTTYFLNLVMGNLFHTQTTPAIPTTYYLGLSSTTPTIGGTNVTEPTIGATTGYYRIPISNLSTPTGGVITNTSANDFAESITNWGVMTNSVIFDAATGGNLLMYNALTLSRTVEAENVVTIKSGSLSLQLSNPA